MVILIYIHLPSWSLTFLQTTLVTSMVLVNMGLVMIWLVVYFPLLSFYFSSLGFIFPRLVLFSLVFVSLVLVFVLLTLDIVLLSPTRFSQRRKWSDLILDFVHDSPSLEARSLSS